MDTKTYDVNVECANCGNKETITLPVGQQISDEKCRHCGCKCLRLGYNSIWPRPYQPDYIPWHWPGDGPNRTIPYRISPSTGDSIQCNEQPCLAEQCAEQARRDQGLPPGSPVAISISCPCPKCNPRC